MSRPDDVAATVEWWPLVGVAYRKDGQSERDHPTAELVDCMGDRPPDRQRLVAPDDRDSVVSAEHPAATVEWNPTPEQRKHASNTLIDLWEYAEEADDDKLAEVVKDTLDRLGLPWIRLT